MGLMDLFCQVLKFQYDYTVGNNTTILILLPDVRTAVGVRPLFDITRWEVDVANPGMEATASSATSDYVFILSYEKLTAADIDRTVATATAVTIADTRVFDLFHIHRRETLTTSGFFFRDKVFPVVRQMDGGAGTGRICTEDRLYLAIRFEPGASTNAVRTGVRLWYRIYNSDPEEVQGELLTRQSRTVVAV